MQIYDITVAPNRVQEVASSGRYIYYYNGSAGGADASITVKHDMSGTAIVLKPGQAFRLDDKERGGGRWLIGNYANTAPILGRIVVGNGRIDDNNVTGSVEVIDGGKNRTLAGSAFMCSVYSSAGAGLFPHVQLLNPVGSGKRLAIESLRVIGSVAGWSADLRRYDTPLTNNTQAAASKRPGTGVSVVQLRDQAINAYTYTGQSYALLGNSGANGSDSIKLSEPIIIDPGVGIVVFAYQSNSNINAIVEWFEEANI